MFEFEDMDDDCARNDRAYRTVASTLRRMLQRMYVYMKRTYQLATNMLWEKMDGLIQERAGKLALAVFPKVGMTGW